MYTCIYIYYIYLYISHVISPSYITLSAITMTIYPIDSLFECPWVPAFRDSSSEGSALPVFC